MVNVGQLRALVVRPTLEWLAKAEPRLDSPAAEELLLGTAVHESTIRGVTHLRQLPDGPALGMWQMEPATERYLLEWLTSNRMLRVGVLALSGQVHRPDPMVCNLAYACAMARLKYWTVPVPLPSAENIEAMSRYWDRYYQTVVDEVEPRRWAASYREYVLPTKGLS